MRLPKPNLKLILLYYSVILSTILIIGGFYTVRSLKEIISNLLFLPVVIFLWLTLIQHRRQRIKLTQIQNSKVKTTTQKSKLV